MLLEWYRADSSRRLRKVLGIGAGVLTSGALLTGLSFASHQHETLRNSAVVIGLLCTMGGALVAVIGLQRILAEDAYIAVRTDGILVHLGAHEEVLAWSDMERIRFDPARAAVVFTRRDGGELVIQRPLSGATHETLAPHLDSLRRKAEWNLLEA